MTGLRMILNLDEDDVTQIQSAVAETYGEDSTLFDLVAGHVEQTLDEFRSAAAEPDYEDERDDPRRD